MSSGFIASNGQDLDDIFHPRESGDPIHSSDTGYAVGSQDLRNRYWPLSDDGTAPSSSTGYRVGSTDLQNIFAEIDTVSQWDGQFPSFSMLYTDVGGSDPSRPPLSEIIFDPSGTIIHRSNHPSGSEVSLGRWDGDVANSTNTEVRFTLLSGATDDPLNESWRQLEFRYGFLVQASENDPLQEASVQVTLREIGKPSTEITEIINIEARFTAGPGGDNEFE